MVPILENGESNGIGHTFGTFAERFIEICNNHKKEARAFGFAFIFYDFENHPIIDILHSQGGFTQLDRLSGKDLSIFFLQSYDPETIRRFNTVFQRAFQIEERIGSSFVLLFDVNGEEISDVEIVILEQRSPYFVFPELYHVIETYKKKLISGQNQKEKSIFRQIKILLGLEPKEVKKIAVTEFIKLILSEAYKHSLF